MFHCTVWQRVCSRSEVTLNWHVSVRKRGMFYMLTLRTDTELASYRLELTCCRLKRACYLSVTVRNWRVIYCCSEWHWTGMLPFRCFGAFTFRTGGLHFRAEPLTFSAGRLPVRVACHRLALARCLVELTCYLSELKCYCS